MLICIKWIEYFESKAPGKVDEGDAGRMKDAAAEVDNARGVGAIFSPDSVL